MSGNFGDAVVIRTEFPIIGADQLEPLQPAMPRLHPLRIHLKPFQVAQIRAISEASGASASEVVRRLLDIGLQACTVVDS